MNRFVNMWFILTLVVAQIVLSPIPAQITSSVYKQHEVNKIGDQIYTEAFAMDLLERLSQNTLSEKYNFFVAPLSIYSLLILLAEGSAGESLKGFQKMLRLPSDLTYYRSLYRRMQQTHEMNTSAAEIYAMNVFFWDINRPIKSDFRYKLDNVYKADHVSLVFQNDTRDKINEMVNERTRGKIMKIVNMDDLEDAPVLLISGITFEGHWKVWALESMQYAVPNVLQ